MRKERVPPHLPHQPAIPKQLTIQLNNDTTPLWGKMTAQQMVEHLIVNVEYTNGKKVCTCDNTPEDAELGKQVMVYTDAPIPKNVFLEDLPGDYYYPDLQTAIEQLMQELDDFEHYFQEPDAISIHSSFGPMDHEEWLIWHSKHFTHHLLQFGVL